MKIVLTGGGTGGHTFPLISVSKRLIEKTQSQNIPLSIIFMGPMEDMSSYLNIRTKTIYIVSGKWRRYFSIKNFLDIFKIVVGFIQAYIHLFIIMPDIIFSKGGYGSFPVVAVAWLFRIPILLHESDSVTGTANKILVKFSKKIITSFPSEYSELPKDKVINLGNPVRDLRGGNTEEAYKEFNITTEKPIIFIVGGSQGAIQINDLIYLMLKELIEQYEIIHQVGKKHYDSYLKRIEKQIGENITSYHAYSFLNERQMSGAFAISSLVISRAGASAIFELALVGKPSILIPLESSARGHQEKNAQIYEKIGACVSISPVNINEHLLMNQINNLMQNKQKLIQMSSAAFTFSKPDSAQNIAKLILKTVAVAEGA